MRGQSPVSECVYPSPVNRSCFGALKAEKASAETMPYCCKAATHLEKGEERTSAGEGLRTAGCILTQQGVACKGLTQALPVGCTRCQLSRKDTTTGN